MCYASNIPCVCLLICRVRAAGTTCHNNCMGTLFFSIRWHFVHSMNVILSVTLLSHKNWTITRITVAVLQHAVFWTADDTLLCDVPTWIHLWLSLVPQLCCAVQGWLSQLPLPVITGEVNFIKNINPCYNGEVHIYVILLICIYLVVW